MGHAVACAFAGNPGCPHRPESAADRPSRAARTTFADAVSGIQMAAWMLEELAPRSSVEHVNENTEFEGRIQVRRVPVGLRRRSTCRNRVFEQQRKGRRWRWPRRNG